MIAQSRLDPRNSSGSSVGLHGDNFKLGGGRYDAAHPDVPSPLGGIQGKEGFFGLVISGHVIIGGTYERGSWQDHLVEMFAGPHDWMNSGFFYDQQGNIRQNMGFIEEIFGTALNYTNVLVASPFAFASAVTDDANAMVLSAQYGL